MLRNFPVCCFGILLSLHCTTVNAAVYFEDFNSDSGGWQALKNGGVDVGVHVPTGGVGNSGYLEGTRPDGFAPAFNPGNPPASASGLGDIGAVYGNLIEISYYGRIFSMGTDQPILHLFNSSNSATFWVKEIVPTTGVAAFRADWTPASVIIDTSWSDAEAIAHGWSQGGTSGTASWASVLSDLTSNHPFYGFSGGSASAGIDNVRIASVPLPGGLLLLSSALAGLLGRRRGR